MTSLSDIVLKIGDSIKFRHLGIGFVWAWIYCSFETSALYPDRSGVGINADISWLASAASVALCLFAFGFFFRFRDLSNRKNLPFIAAALMACGTFASAMAGDSAAVGVLSGIATGVGSALLIVLWGDALFRIDAERAEVAIPAASGVMLACSFVFPYIEGIVAVVGVSALPVFSAVCLVLTYGDASDGSGEGGRSEKQAEACGVRLLSYGSTAVHAGRSKAVGGKKTTGALLRFCLLVCVAYFVIGFFSALGSPESAFQEAYGFDVSTLVGSVSGLCLAVWFIFFSSRIDMTALFRWLSPLMMIGIAAASFDGVLPETVLSVVISIADAVLQVVVMLYFLGMARRGPFAAAFVVGVSQGFIQAGILLGNLTGAKTGDLIASGACEMWALSLALVCLLSLAMALAPTGYVASMRIAPHGESDMLDGENSNMPLTEEKAREKRVAELSAEKGLSARESEVLGYLAKGRSQPYIREELVLSKNTVATHVKHIYQKLGVHSKQELLDLFEG